MFHLGFHAFGVDSNLFILIHSFCVVYLLLYVDDIIITGSPSFLTGNSPSFFSGIIKQPSATFSLKDLGPLSYFLGLQFEYTLASIFVHQSNYAQDLLIKFKMLDYKSCPNPRSSNHHLVLANSLVFSDPTVYRCMVGVFQ